jgi:hypothetical protein
VHRRRSLALYLPASLRKRKQEEEIHRGLSTHSGPTNKRDLIFVFSARHGRPRINIYSLSTVGPEWLANPGDRYRSSLGRAGPLGAFSAVFPSVCARHTVPAGLMSRYQQEPVLFWQLGSAASPLHPRRLESVFPGARVYQVPA